MLLTFPNGDVFATASAKYHYDPAPGSDKSARLILWVEVEGQPTSAIVDTGAPYFVCSPELARDIDFYEAAALSPHTMLIRGYLVKGHLH